MTNSNRNFALFISKFREKHISSKSRSRLFTVKRLLSKGVITILDFESKCEIGLHVLSKSITIYAGSKVLFGHACSV